VHGKVLDLTGVRDRAYVLLAEVVMLMIVKINDILIWSMSEIDRHSLSCRSSVFEVAN
jgi:hypothetical protein